MTCYHCGRSPALVYRRGESTPRPALHLCQQASVQFRAMCLYVTPLSTLYNCQRGLPEHQLVHP